MLKKVFCITMFGESFPWIDQFIDHVQHLEEYGWYWKIFTPNTLESKGNVEIIPMTTDDFNDLVEKKTGVRPNVGLMDGRPTVHVTDFYVASGLIFGDYLKDADFWGITNMDIVYGRLDHFYPDSLLDQYDIYTDDVKVINGIFCLFRNKPNINNLFWEIPDIKEKLAQPPCPRCSKTGFDHILFGTDEYDMTEVVKNDITGIRYGYPQYYPLHSYDRLEQHIPTPKLEMKADGSLWELFTDVDGPAWIHAHPLMGREIPYFHFIRTKTWPL